MRTLTLLLTLFGLLTLAGSAHADGGHDSSAGQRARVVTEARKLVGIREVGRNAGPDVERIIKFAGGRTGDAWCSWTIVAVMRWAGVMVPRFGAARSWFDKAHTIWAGAQLPGKPAPQPGDALGFRWGRPAIGHVELLVAWGTGPSCRSIGGNTGGGGALVREGEGVYENWRLKRQVSAVANIIDNPKY